MKARGQKQLIAFRVPGFVEGLIAREDVGVRGAGDAFPQGLVGRGGTEGRFDDIAGGGFLIVSRGERPLVSPGDAAFWASLGGRFAHISDATGDIADVEEVYTQLMNEYGCDVLLKRPDYYLFGACRTAKDLPALIGDLRGQIQNRS